MLKMIGPSGAIANSIHIKSPDEQLVKLYRTRLIPNDHSYLEGSRLNSSASKVDRRHSVIAAAGEALERYALGIPKKPALQNGTVPRRLAGNTALSLDELRKLQGLCEFQFSLPGCRLLPMSEETSFEWIEASRLLDESNVLVPQEMVQLRRKAVPFFEVTTNGCALSSSRTGAILSASYELIERNNMMMLWWRKEKPVFVDFKNDLQKFNPELFRAFGPWLRYVDVIYHPGALGIPTFISFFRSENSRSHPAFFISAATHLNPQKALEGTLQELGTILNTKLIRHFSKPGSQDSFLYDLDREFYDFKNHHEFYMFDRNLRFLHFLSLQHEPSARIAFSQIPDLETGDETSNLELVRRHFKQQGHNPIIVDHSTRDVHEIGLHVVRVIDSDIIDLNAAHAHRRWGKIRLYDHDLTSPDQLHQWPHPFP